MHWGAENDGYVCSSPWMKQAYKHRPADFKRRILQKVYTNRKDLYEAEKYWLSLIKDNELRLRYYNLSKNVHDTWLNEELYLSRKEKLKNNHWSKNIDIADEIRNKISEKNKGKSPPNKGIDWTDEQREMYTIAMKGHKKPERSIEHKQKISENNKKLQEEKRIGMYNKKHNDDTLKLMSLNNAMNNPLYVEKVKEAKNNIKWLINKDNIKKMAVPGSIKWAELLEQGFEPMNKAIGG
jgi:hypothetical protein